MNYEANENDIIIESVTEYITKIQEINSNIIASELKNHIGFFRGQANSFWEVMPSVFRDNLVRSEHELIRLALNINPNEFNQFDSDFIKLTKLQHYGLPTRLLDLTTNPLVALYFACEETFVDNTLTEETDENTKVLADGCVYYKYEYGCGYNESIVSIISYLSNLNFDSGYTLDDCLNDLVKKGFYSESEAKNCRNNNYESLIKDLQKDIFVIPNMNNERIIRQNGSFLLSSCFNIYKDFDTYKIEKAKKDIKNNFELERFIIPSDKKQEILEQLNLLNINEAFLFPELEHQLEYIKKNQKKKNLPSTNSFEPFDFENTTKPDPDILYNINIKIKTSQIANNIIKDKISNIELQKKCLKIIENKTAIDWYLKKSNISQLRVSLYRLLNMNGINNAKSLSTDIVNQIQSQIIEESKNLKS